DPRPLIIGNFAQQRVAIKFFFGAVRMSKRFVNADGIELGISLFYQSFDIAFAEPAVIIATVRYYEQSTFSVVRTPHLAEPQVNSIEEGSAALCRSEYHTALQILSAIGIVTGQFGALVKADEKE